MSPIKPENRQKYPPNWDEISLKVRGEASQRCEICRVCNGATGYRHGLIADFCSVSRTDQSSILAHIQRLIPGFRFLRIILTVHHKDGDPTNNDRSNLTALCQRCHLDADRRLRSDRRYREESIRQPSLDLKNQPTPGDRNEQCDH